MRALVKSRPEPGLWLEQIDEPATQPGSVKIMVKRASICGTDLHIYRWDDWAAATIPLPMAIGHEFSGEIVDVGEAVVGLEVGMRVSGEGHITCGHCRNCRAGRRNLCRNTNGLGVERPGAFADYVTLPAGNVFPLPDHVDDEHGSILDPLGNATHTALAFELVGEDLLVTGAGPIGLMAVAIARHIGARFIVVTDPNPYRRGLAAGMGASLTLDPNVTSPGTAMASLGMVEGYDVGLEMSGNPSALHQMIEAMNHGGRVALLGIPAQPTEMDWNAMIFKSLTVRGIYGRRIFETWYKMTAMLQTGLDVSQVITHRFGVDDYDDAFAAVASGEAAKVILEWAD